MFSVKRLLLGLGLFGAAHLHASMDVAAPAKIIWNGFIHYWATAGEDSNAKDIKEYKWSGSLLKRFRFKMGAEVFDGVNVVLVPELAGQWSGPVTTVDFTKSATTSGQVFGFQLLDAYGTIDLSKYLIDSSIPLTFTFGQFKTPFGLNRMYTPPQLALIDYSSIYNGPNGVMQTTTFWDDGLMLTWKQGTMLKVDLAWVEGLGIDQAAPGGNAFGQKPNQDLVGKVEFMPPFVSGLTIGASYYNGEAFGNSGTPGFPNKPKNFTGVHLKYAMFGKSLAAETEFINRDLDRGGFTAQLSYYIIDEIQLVAGYDHVVIYTTAGAAPTLKIGDKGDTTRFLGGVNWFPGGPVRVSLQQLGTAAGPSESPTDSKTILQTQVIW